VDIALLRGEIVGLRGEMRRVEKRTEDGFTSIRSEMNVRLRRPRRRVHPTSRLCKQGARRILEIGEPAPLETRLASQS